jgi:hypothetical protein
MHEHDTGGCGRVEVDRSVQLKAGTGIYAQRFSQLTRRPEVHGGTTAFKDDGSIKGPVHRRPLTWKNHPIYGVAVAPQIDSAQRHGWKDHLCG